MHVAYKPSKTYHGDAVTYNKQTGLGYALSSSTAKSLNTYLIELGLATKQHNEYTKIYTSNGGFKTLLKDALDTVQHLVHSYEGELGPRDNVYIYNGIVVTLASDNYQTIKNNIFADVVLLCILPILGGISMMLAV